MTPSGRSASKWNDFRTAFAALLAFGLLSTDSSIRAQPPGPAAAPGVESDTDTPLIVQNRQVIGLLERATEAVRNGDFATGLPLIQQVIDRVDEEEDSFRQVGTRPPDDGGFQTRFISLKFEAEQLLAGLPREGRRVYELQSGNTARRLLDAARARDDFDAIDEVARRYFHTEAGVTATLMLGNRYLDLGRPLEAASCFRQLRRRTEIVQNYEPALSLKEALAWSLADMPQLATQTLMAARDAADGNTLRMGTREIEFFRLESQALAWLSGIFGDVEINVSAGRRNWLYDGGSAQRSRAGDEPPGPEWTSRWSRQPLSSSVLDESLSAPLAAAEARVGPLIASTRAERLLTVPAASPLIVDHLAVFRGLGNLKAVDIASGELVWESFAFDPSLEYLLVPRRNLNGGPRQPQHVPPVDVFLDERFWRDRTSGSLSSDGTVVYAVEECGFQSGGMFGALPGSALAASEFNVLRAYEVATGKAIWQAGGWYRNRDAQLSGHFFLGPPLPIGNRLYVLAETDGLIKLLALAPEVNADTGQWDIRSLWSQTLAVPVQNIRAHAIRRFSALSPTFADGLLICPTGSGSIVAVDPTRRQLVWGYQYGQPPVPVSGIRFGPPGFGRTASSSHNGPGTDAGRWLDAVTISHAGRVVATPRDGSELYCFDAGDGRLVWKRPRGQGLFVGTVHRDMVVVVGQSRIEAFRLDDGRPAWSEPVATGMPGGRGFRSGDVYHLPQADGKVASLDLNHGRLLAVVPVGDNRTLGNLVSAGDVLVSQAADAISVIRPAASQMNELHQRLEQDPDDAAALSLRAIASLQRGEVDPALGDLRASLTANPTPQVRQLLMQTLIESLRIDYDGNRELDSELMALIREDDAADVPAVVDLFLSSLIPSGARMAEASRLSGRLTQRPDFLDRRQLIIARGRQSAGEWVAAFEAWDELSRIDRPDNALIPVDGVVSVRDDRLVSARIDDLIRSSSDSARAAIDRLISQRRQAAMASEHRSDLRRYLRLFGSHPVSNAARRAYARRLTSERDRAVLWSQLDRLRTAGVETDAAWATARMASLALDDQRREAAVRRLDDLETRYSDVECVDGMTGLQYAERLRADHSEVLDKPAPWPDSRVWAHEINEFSRSLIVAMGRRRFAIDLKQASGEFRDWTFHLSQSRQSLIACDGSDRERWTVPLLKAGIRNPATLNISALNVGPLLALNYGTGFAVIDVTGQGDSRTVLWGSGATPQRPPSSIIRRNGVAVRIQFPISPGRSPRPTKISVLNSDYAAWLANNQLVAGDPFTGKPYWTRKSVTGDSRVWGDAEFVVVQPPETGHVEIIDARDGRLIRNAQLPPNLHWQDGVPEAGVIPLDSDSRRPREVVRTIGRNVIIRDIDPSGCTVSSFDVVEQTNRWSMDFAPGSVVSPVRADELAIVEPTGRFVVLTADDGRIRVEADIEPIAGLRAVYVLRSPSRYILMTESGDRPTDSPSIFGQPDQQPVNGMVYAFGKQDGKLIWKTDIGHQSLSTRQSPNLPVIVLAARRQKPSPIAGRFLYRYTSDVLDARDGSTIYQQEKVGPNLSNLSLLVEPDENRVTVRFFHEGVRLTIADEEPPPPEPPTPPAPPENSPPSDDAPPGSRPIGKPRPPGAPDAPPGSRPPGAKPPAPPKKSDRPPGSAPKQDDPPPGSRPANKVPPEPAPDPPKEND